MKKVNKSLPQTRRRMLSVIAGLGIAAGASLLMPGAALAKPPRRFEWRGTALGAEASILLYHADAGEAEAAVKRSVLEIERLESEFSLYRKDSALCRLNRDGFLAAPSLDMVRLLSQCVRFGDLSDGAFDVTVQPLWRLYRDHFAAHPGDLSGPPRAAVEAARALVDYRRIEIGMPRIRLQAGTELTLNGIAQGYITDRVADLLRRLGWSNVLVNLGELRALDGRGDGSPWAVALNGVGDGVADGLTVPLVNRAMATSAGGGTRFESTGRHHHLFDPVSGNSPGHFRSVSVAAPDATTADALSTAIFTAPKDRARKIVTRAARKADVAAWLTDAGGKTKFLKS